MDLSQAYIKRASQAFKEIKKSSPSVGLIYRESERTWPSCGRKRRFYHLESSSRILLPPSRRVPMATLHSHAAVSVIATADIKGTAPLTSSCTSTLHLRFKPRELPIFPIHRRVVLKGINISSFLLRVVVVGDMDRIGCLLTRDIFFVFRDSNKGAIERRSKYSSSCGRCIYQ